MNENQHTAQWCFDNPSAAANLVGVLKTELDKLQVDSLAVCRERDRMLALLRSVQTDAGNWLHAELQAAIEKEIGPAGPYRNLSDSGVAESETPAHD